MCLVLPTVGLSYAKPLACRVPWSEGAEAPKTEADGTGKEGQATEAAQINRSINTASSTHRIVSKYLCFVCECERFLMR